LTHWGWPTINRHDRPLLGERGGSLPRQLPESIAFSNSSRGHVVLHDVSFLQLVSDRVRMIWAGCFEKLFKVIGGLPLQALRITLGGGTRSSSESPASLSLPASSQLVATVTHHGCHFSPSCRLPSLHPCWLPWLAPPDHRWGPPLHCSAQKEP
jgi:hypothetical protein